MSECWINVLCRKDAPQKQWLAGSWATKAEAIRSQGKILTRAEYAGLRPLYRLHITLKPVA